MRPFHCMRRFETRLPTSPLPAATDGSPALTVDYFNQNQARSVAAIESSITQIPSDWIDVVGSPPGSPAAAAGRRLLQLQAGAGPAAEPSAARRQRRRLLQAGAGRVLVDSRLFGGEEQLDNAVTAFNASLINGQFDRLLRGEREAGEARLTAASASALPGMRRAA